MKLPSRFGRAVALSAIVFAFSANYAMADDSAVTKSSRWDLGNLKDGPSAALPRFFNPERMGKPGSDNNIKYRTLQPYIFQTILTFPAFDFDPKTGSLNAPFYLTVRFKDTAMLPHPTTKQVPPNTPFQVYTRHGGSNFYGYGLSGFIGGAADDQWKEETIIIRRSSLRTEDGKTFSISLTNVKSEFPVAWMELFSANATNIPDKDQRIAAAVALEKKRHEAELAQFLPLFKNAGLPDPGPSPELTAQEKERGLRIFFPPLSRGIFANSEPAPEELATPLKLYACPAQTQSVMVALRGLKDLGQVSLTLSDLNGPAVLPTAKSTVRWGVYMEKRVLVSGGKAYQVRPDQLAIQPSQLVTPERVELASITLKVPADAVAGEYRGTIEALCAKGNKVSVPVQLTVYPFQLEHPDHGTHGMYCYNGYGDISPIEIQDMLDHGMDTINAGMMPQLGTDKDGKHLDIDKVKEGYRTLKQMGFRSPIVCRTDPVHDLGMEAMKNKDKLEKNRKTAVELVALSKKLAEEAGFTVSFFPVDEPQDTKPTSQALAKLTCEWIKEVPGARTYITANPGYVAKYGQPALLDDVCYNWSYINQKRVDQIHQSGQTFMFYGPYWGERPAEARMRVGYYFWRTGAQLVHLFAYGEINEDPFCDLDGRFRDFTPSYPSMNSIYPDPCVNWEAVREGVNDYQYLYTLQASADRAEKAGKAQAAATARKVLDEVRTQVDIDGNKMAGPSGALEADAALLNTKLDPALAKNARSLMPASWYDQTRQKVANAIIDCQKATLQKK